MIRIFAYGLAVLTCACAVSQTLPVQDLAVYGDTTLGTSSAEDSVTMPAEGTVTGSLRFPATSGQIPWGAVPLIFGGTIGSEFGNGSPFMAYAGDFAPGGNTGTFVMNIWGDLLTTLAIENTDTDDGFSLLIEDRFKFVAGDSVQEPVFRWTDTMQTPGIIANSGTNDFWGEFSDDNLDVYIATAGSSQAGVSVRQDTVSTADNFIQLIWEGDAFLGMRSANTAGTLQSNPSGRLTVYGGEDTGAVTDSSFDNLGGGVEIHGWGSQTDWQLQSYWDQLVFWDSNSDSYGGSGGILIFDNSDSEITVRDSWDFTVQSPGVSAGTRDVLRFTRLGSSAGTNQLIYMDQTPADDHGVYMIRAGSITGAAINYEITGASGAGAWNVEVLVNGTEVYSLPSVTAAALQDWHGTATQARGTDTFTANDEISVRVDGPTANHTIEDIVVDVEVVYDD